MAGKKKGRKEKNKELEEDEQSMNFRAEISKLKRKKAVEKSSFTRIKHQLIESIAEDELSSQNEVRSLRAKLSDQQEQVINVLVELSHQYEKFNDNENVELINNEIEEINNEFEKIMKDANGYLASHKGDGSSIGTRVSSKMSQLYVSEARAREQEKRVREELQAKEHILRQKQQQLEEKYRAEKTRLEQELAAQKIKLQEASKKTKQCHQQLETEIETELGMDHGEADNETASFMIERPCVNAYNRNVYEQEAQSARHINSKAADIGQDLWKQLKRVSIPVFYGDKKTYEMWKAAFTACIDQAPATAEYKLLQLRQYLSGEALSAIDGLGHSAFAYEAAKERLERKYGGTRRKVMIYLDELDNFKPIREDHPRDIERFADLLDVAVTNLREAKLTEELGSGTLYHKLLRKMTEKMLSRFKRWVYEHQKNEDVETLRQFIIEEAEFQVAAAETIHGFHKNMVTRPKNSSSSFFGADDRSKKLKFLRKCYVCQNDHMIWDCSAFKSKKVNQRWEIAKKQKLCFKCLRSNHLARACRNSRICGIDGCTDTHNRLLHKNKEDVVDKVKTRETEKGHEGESVESSHTSTLSKEKQDEVKFVSLRTVPVVLKNGNKKIVVNALLDDGSTKTYLNSDVATELDLKGERQNVTVSMLNGVADSLETMPVEFQLESLDGKLKTQIQALTVNRVTGNLRAVNWVKMANNWKHLKDIKFPSVGPKPTIDILIGVDHADLHCAQREVKGKANEPVARLTPLGWTCVGDCNGQVISTNFVMSPKDDRELIKINSTIRKLWEIEGDESIKDKTLMCPEDIEALEMVKNSLEYHDGRYEIRIPWKKERKLDDNYEMALNRLANTEKRLLRDIQLGNSYNEIIQQYLRKGYLEKVDKESGKDCWYLPHFPVLRPDKATTKVRIVFDGSAKYNGMSVNDVIHQGPKLQQDLVKVLLRFRKHPVALVCDIAEMYLQIGIHPDDRQYQRILWRNMDQTAEPDVLQFNRMVFGINSSPFGAQFVSQEHARRSAEELPMAASSVLDSTYMDDTMDSVTDDEAGIKLYTELSELWHSAGMYARKWLSNSTAVLKVIPETDRAENIDLDAGELPSVKTLGIVWNAQRDVFTYKSVKQAEGTTYTKRFLLKEMATLFDPLGFISPYVIRIKVIMQELWLRGLNWDDELPGNVVTKIKAWFHELEKLPLIQIPRCLRTTSLVTSQFIHVFTDASSEAYGAVAYLQSVYESGEYSSRLIITENSQWRYIPTKKNPADLLSRGLSVTALVQNENEYWTQHPEIHDVPVYYASSLAKKCMAVYQTYIGAMNEKIRKQINVSNPFVFKHISNLKSIDQFDDIGPSVVMASPGMMQSGLSRELFETWCADRKNGVIIAGYCVEGTLAKDLMREPEEIVTMSGQNLPLKMQVSYISFSAHADYEQLNEFVNILKPPHIVLVHGEQNEMSRLKAALIRDFDEKGLSHIQVYNPKNVQSVQLHFRGEKMAKVIGSLASEQPANGKSISGLLLKRGFNYHIMSPNDLQNYTDLATSSITQRQILHFRAPFNIVYYCLQTLAGKVEKLEIQGKQAFKVFDAITIYQEKGSVIIEWPSNPVNDMYADCVLTVILQVEGNPQFVQELQDWQHQI
eukprot:gene12680-3393_t